MLASIIHRLQKTIVFKQGSKRLLYFLIVFTPMLLASQNTYYSFQNELYDEERFREKLNDIEDIYSKQGDYKYTTASYKIQSIETRVDSLIQHVEVILSQSNTAPLDINKGVQALLNKPFPKFQLTDNFHKLKTNQDFKGQVTVINLWFTNCRPCITEIPYLNYLKDQYQDDVRFIAITFDTADMVNTFLERKAFSFDHLVDAAYFLNEDLKNNAYPKIILVDKKGIVRFAENGVQLGLANPSQPQAAVQGIQQQLALLLNE